jgi:hypothetical protein
MRTPQTLTLVGELEEDDEVDYDDDNENDDEDESQQVEVLLSFDHRGTDYNLVRMLDPILLVGKADPSSPTNRLLLTPDEAEVVMPIIEEMFLELQADEGRL